MPIPTPNEGEEKSKFISRCVSFLSSEGKGTNEQRVAICYSQWRKSNMNKKWVKFLAEYKSGEDKFAKGTVIEIDEQTANALIKLAIAEETTKPEDDSVVSKTVNDFTEKVTKMIEGGISSAMGAATEKFNKEVKFHAVPRDHEEEEGMRGFQNEGEFMKAVMDYATGTPIEDERIQKAVLGQNTLDAAEGGLFVPETLESRIWEQVADDYEYNFYAQAQKKYTSGQSLKFNRSFESSRADGYRHQGGLGYWTQEADEYTASVLKWSTMRLELNKLTALYYATDEELEDANISMSSIFTDNASKVIRWKLNKSMIDGTGVGQPLGVQNANATILIAIEAGQVLATNPIMHANINKMYHRMIPSSRGRANWFVHPNMEEKLPFIKFDDDVTVGYNPVYIPAGGISGKPYGSLYGRPVIPCEFCSDLGTIGDIIFADFSQYVSLQKRGRGIRSASSIHVQFLTGQTAFRFDFRADAQPLWSSPITDLNGSTQRSPFIMLDIRS